MPAILSAVTQAVSAKGINIDNMVNRSRGNMAYTVLETDTPIPEGVLAELLQNPDILAARSIG